MKLVAGHLFTSDLLRMVSPQIRLCNHERTVKYLNDELFCLDNLCANLDGNLGCGLGDVLLVAKFDKAAGGVHRYSLCFISKRVRRYDAVIRTGLKSSIKRK